MSDKPDKCPYCESEIKTETLWACGTNRLNHSMSYRNPKCYARQIANLQAELASAREFIEEVVQIGRLMKNA